MKKIHNSSNQFAFLRQSFLLILALFIMGSTNGWGQTYHNLSGGSFSQNWTNTGLITTNNDWTGVPSIIGYRGDDITNTTAVDPQTLLGEGTINVIVTANQTTPSTINTGGIYEFELTDPVVAFQGSGTADAPNIVIYLNTTGVSNIHVQYNLRDIDGAVDDAIQPVALQYRIGTTGNFTNIPAGFVADASTGPSLATLVTPVNVTLPIACENQSQLQLRIITSNAVGNDEWIGIDDILIFAPCSGTPVAGTAGTTPQAKCPGSTASMSVSGYSPENGITFQWEQSANGTDGWANVSGGSGGNTSSYTSGALSTTTYYRCAVTCTNSLETSFTNNVVVNMLNKPTAIVIVDDNTVCAGDPIEISVALTGTGPWLLHGLTKTEIGGSTDVLPDTLVTTSPHLIYDNPKLSAFYHIENFTDNSTGCMNDTANWVMVTATPLPTAVLSANNTNVCEGDIVDFTINLSGTGPWLLHGLTVSKFSGSVQVIPDIPVTTSPYTISQPVSSSAYYHIESITDFGTGCINDTANWLTIIVNPVPTAIVTVDDNSVCAGDPIEISIALTGTGPWLLHGLTKTEIGGPTDVLPDTLVTTNPFLIYDNPVVSASYHIESFTDNSTGCTNDTANWIMVTAAPLPTAVLSASNTNVCESNIIDLSINLTGTGPWLLHGLTVSKIDGSVQIIPDFPVSVSPFMSSFPPDSSTIYHIENITDQGTGCTNDTANWLTIIVNPLPVVTAVSLQSSTDQSNWSAINGDLVSGYNMCINPVTPFHYLDINTLTGPVNPLTDNFSQNAFMLDVTSVPSGFYTYWANMGVVSGATGWEGVMWNIINGTAPMFYINYTGTDYQLLDGLQYQVGGVEQTLRLTGDYPQGNYKFTGSVTDINGCASSSFDVFLEMNPLPAPTISGPNSPCFGILYVYATETGMSNYTWHPDGGLIAGYSPNHDSVTIAWSSLGSHSLAVNYTNANGCSADAPTTYSVTVNEVTVPVISGDTSACIGTSHVYETETGMSAYQWSVSSGGTITSGGGANDNTATITWNNAGPQNLSVLYTNSYGCAIEFPVQFDANVHGYPVVALGNDNTICADQTVLLDAENPGSSYLWTPDGETSQTIMADTLGHGIGNVEYIVVVTSHGCATSDTINITFDPCTGIGTVDDGISVSVVPNPSNGLFYLNVEGINETVTLNIYSITGQAIYTEQLDKTGLVNKPVDLKSFPKGMYFLRLINNNMTHTEKIIIE